jgi:tetratricopeptide (TPR) repeat protein
MPATDVPSGREEVIAQTAPWRARLQALATGSRLAPEHADFLYVAGQALAAQGRHVDALNCFTFLVASCPADARYLASFADTHLAMAHFEEALVAYRALDVLDPFQPAHTLAIAQCLLSLQRHEDAAYLLDVVVTFCAEDAQRSPVQQRAIGLRDLIRRTHEPCH